MKKGVAAGTAGSSVALQLRISDTLVVPQYLEQTYWWAYLHPKGVRFFERQWLVNVILWGNFARLRDAALAEMGTTIQGRLLQVACVYGDFTPRLAARLARDARLDVIDVAPVQLENVKRKLSSGSNVHLHHQDSTELAFQDGEFDNVVVFFLLHEQPEDVRQRTVCEALRVVKPGGKVVFVDYHRPSFFNPFRYIMMPILYALEPFALDLWHQEIVSWAMRFGGSGDVPDGGISRLGQVRKETFFGGLYQKVVLERAGLGETVGQQTTMPVL
ncbi:MAG: rhodoquinone biosynthesis methyltransferase RquA [Magnetococcus sp. DMHC-8]